MHCFESSPLQGQTQSHWPSISKVIPNARQVPRASVVYVLGIGMAYIGAREYNECPEGADTNSISLETFQKEWYVCYRHDTFVEY